MSEQRQLPVDNDSVTTSHQQSSPDEFLESNIFDHYSAIELTQREKEILTHLVDGKTNKEIARELGRVERTVEYHRNRLMNKLDAHNAAELLKNAVAAGLCII
jgi:DNA-binding NarL/FixJ family response regulator